ncbi:hypothetical protein [Frigoriglobus tundricola]|uniref:Uncharacterized protein n=1 Tax=Frigoriglobus tundricola TaxID=2774151 RepID=A0A6M5YRN3_9BACT|nr:hypothetical protein [Frigoriglobus tundricola]QJW96589.1 hypothetical protein FTUN_4146 [Frigoriglobus tundricola]
MNSGFLALALLGPAAPTEGLQKGDELKFVGTVEEAVDRPGNRFRRSQALVVRVLVLERTDAWTDVAVLTLLTRTDDAVTGAVAAVTGGAPEKAHPPGVRLDLVRAHADGTAHVLLPVGAPPLALDAKTPARTLPVPRSTPSPRSSSACSRPGRRRPPRTSRGRSRPPTRAGRPKRGRRRAPTW